MTKTLSFHPARAVALLTGLVAAVLLLAPGAHSGGSSLAVCNGADYVTCTGGPFNTADGVYFNVSTGGGNRDFASVQVSCSDGYATKLTVEVPAKGTGSSQIIHPSPAACTADLVKQMQIGKDHPLGSVSFTVS